MLLLAPMTGFIILPLVLSSLGAERSAGGSFIALTVLLVAMESVSRRKKCVFGGVGGASTCAHKSEWCSSLTQWYFERKVIHYFTWETPPQPTTLGYNRNRTSLFSSLPAPALSDCLSMPLDSYYSLSLACPTQMNYFIWWHGSWLLIIHWVSSLEFSSVLHT